MRQKSSPSSATTINAWGVVRARTTAAVMLHGVIIGIIYSVLSGTWNFLLGTSFGFSQGQSFGMAVGISVVVLVVSFLRKRTPASIGGGYENH